MNDTVPKSDPKKSGGGCFIATAAYGDYTAPEVVYLYAIRDEFLAKTILGRGFIRFYYLVSPPVADLVRRSDILRAGVRRIILRPLISLLERLLKIA